jgi:hypothetical protein
MEEKKLRKRIYPAAKLVEVIEDSEAFKKNMVTDNARKVRTVREEVFYEIWHDKHYHDRHQHGDDNGKREGIDPDTVHDLLERAMPYLLLCGVSHLGFRFVNHGGNPETVKTVLQRQTDVGLLNVVIWTQMVDPTNGDAYFFIKFSRFIV